MLIQGWLERTETNLMHFKWEVTNTRKPTQYILGQFYSHAYVDTRETWTHGDQPKAFLMGGELNARKPT